MDAASVSAGGERGWGRSMNEVERGNYRGNDISLSLNKFLRTSLAKAVHNLQATLSKKYRYFNL